MTDVIYIAKPEYLNELCEELGDITHIIGNLVFSPQKKQDICFALDVWLNPQTVTFTSISEAVNILRKAGKFWCLNPISHIRRSHLITHELRKHPSLSHVFPIDNDIPEIGCFSLLDKNTLVYCTKRWKKPPLGDFQFVEDKKNPPNRAYLKLWEALSLLGHYPHPGEYALDLGASPGGWSYVMQSFGTSVIAVDKAPLDKRIATLPHIQFKQQSAFSLEPQSLDKTIDWLLCDVACYPERSLALANKWVNANKARQMIITIKLQGQTDLSVIQQFKMIPNARILHLFYNKHEVTFFYPAPECLYVNFSD